MDRFFAAILAGLANGGIYALLAIAFSIIYMTTRMINFAQGEVMMVGAYIYFFAISKQYLGAPWPVALLLALAGAIAVGLDRKSTRLNSSHGYISYAVF